MKDVFIVISCNLVAMAFAATAGILAYEQKPGWGWFMCFAALCACYVKKTKDQ